jgi:hypothetical protein
MVFRALRCCLNPKVIGGLVAVAVVLWVMAPGGAAALPLLVTLVCPLSMGVMMWQMRRSGGGTAPTISGPATASDSDDTEVAALREELAIERARTQLAQQDGQPRA